MTLIFMQDFEIAGGRDITGMVEKIWRVAQIQNLLDMQEKYKIPQEVIRTVSISLKFWMQNTEWNGM